jgi:hypothetical protein
MTLPSVLYKGSSSSETIFTPKRAATRDIGKLEEAGIKERDVIWAASDKRFAALFAALPSSMEWRPDYRDGTPVIIIHDLDWEEKLSGDAIVYVYSLPSKEFIHLNGIEYVATTKIRPLAREEFNISDILNQYTVYVPHKLTDIVD